MFTQMRMVNFKSWQDTGEVRLAPLTGLFGTNSSGKSSLLQMLLLLKQTAESNDRNLVLKTGSLQEGYVDLGTLQEITYGNTEQMTLNVSWDLPEPLQITIPKARTRTLPLNNLSFESKIAATASTNGFIVQRLSYLSENFSAIMGYDKEEKRYGIAVDVEGKEPTRQRSRPRHISKPYKCYGFSEEALLYYQQAEYLSDLVLAFDRQFSRLYYLGPLREHPRRTYIWGGERPSSVGLKGELAVAALLAAKDERVYSGRGPGRPPKQANYTLHQRIAQWLVDLGLADSFEAKPLVKNGVQYEIRLRRFPSSPSVLITDMGFGVSQVLPVLVLCYYAPEGSTLIFEQPELHLHPAVQAGLADVFIDVIQRRNIQILVESHSEHLVRRLQRRIAEEMITPQQTALYFCDIGDQGSTIQELEVDAYGNIRNWPRHFFGDLTGDLYEMVQEGIKRQMKQ